MALNAAHDRYSADPKITDDRYFRLMQRIYLSISSFIYSCFPMPALYDIARTLYCYVSVATLILRITVPLTYEYVTYTTRLLVNFACPRLSDNKVVCACARAHARSLVYRNGEDTRLRINVEAEEDQGTRIYSDSKILRNTHESIIR